MWKVAIVHHQLHSESAKKVDNIAKRWVYMDTRSVSGFFKAPSGPPRKRSCWSQREMDATDIAPVVKRMRALHSKGLTTSMVVKEFVSCRIVPLQSRDRLVWEYRGVEDRMRLSNSPMSEADLTLMMMTLVGKSLPSDLSEDVAPLYSLHQKARDEVCSKMRTFDRGIFLARGRRLEWPIPVGRSLPPRVKDTPRAWQVPSKRS